MIPNPIVRLSCKDSPNDVPVRVVEMTPELAWYWHYNVQPLIDNNYFHAVEAPSIGKTRADVGWNWPQWRWFRRDAL